MFSTNKTDRHDITEHGWLKVNNFEIPENFGREFLRYLRFLE